MEAIPDWVFISVAIILICATLLFASQTKGGMKKPAHLVVLIIITTAYLFSLTILKDASPQLGLDLQGGVSIVLAAEGDYEESDLEVAADIIRNRVDAVGVAEPEISRHGSNIIVDLPGADNAQEAQELIGQTAELRFRQVAQNMDDPQLQMLMQQLLVNSAADLGIDPGDLEIPEPQLNPQPEQNGESQNGEPATPSGPGMSRTSQADEGQITSVTLQCGGSNPQPVVLEGDLTKPTPRELDDPTKPIIALDRDSLPYFLCPAVLTGDIVDDARRTVDPTTGDIAVGVTLTDQGAREFTEKIGRPLAGHDVAIVLDSVVQSAPRIQPDLANGLRDNQLSITVGPENQAQVVDELATVLRYGSLGVVLEQQSAQQISATLGTDQLTAGIIAGLIGLAFVVLYMFLYYRVLVLVVILGTIVVGLQLYALVTWLGVVQGLALTLAGAVGLIVSMGVTIDSYIIYFEKLKEEIRQGKSVRASLDVGFSKARKTILAGDIVSLIGSVVLYYLASGGVRGFAFFLGLSTLLDLIIALCFMHPLVKVFARNNFILNARFVGIASALGANKQTVGSEK